MIHAFLTIALLAAGAAQADKGEKGEKGEKKEAKWLAKYQEALQLAAKEGKPVVIDASREG